MTDTIDTIPYAALVDRVVRMAQRATPPDATIAVVSKGDHELLQIPDRVGWHFPRRSDGVYVGHHPADSAAAIRHLEALRERGAQFLLIPEPALWWLDHYRGLAEHLESTCRLVVDEVAGRLYAMFRPGSRLCSMDGADEAAWLLELDDASFERSAALDQFDERTLRTLRELVDVGHYSGQRGLEFRDVDEALADYLAEGATARCDPNPLFDTRYYLHRYPEARLAGVNPLVHFVAHSTTEGQDPSPYFDTAYYYAQGPKLLEQRTNALAHYLMQGGQGYNPNPLFGNGYYLANNTDLRRSGGNPLSHYLSGGGAERGLRTSIAHGKILEALARSGRSNLVRENWKSGTILMFTVGGARPSPLRGLAEELAAKHHIECIVVALRGPVEEVGPDNLAKWLILDEYQIACDVLRPSAVRMLARSLTSLGPLLAITEVPDLIATLRSSGIPCFYLPHDMGSLPSRILADAADTADRILVGCSDDYRELATKIGHPPVNASLTSMPVGPRVTEAGVRRFIELATRAIGTDALAHIGDAAMDVDSRRVIIPCSDWNVSGVNASLEALGLELRELGWDIEILFTRDRAYVEASAGSAHHMPQLPYRFLERRRSGVEAMWEALVADLEKNAPCVAFFGYDFLANSVAPVLSDRVGVVAWVQSDDGDYYEQAYRLGRYCNALVSVSDCIRRNITAMNPTIGERTHVVHNSSVWERDVVRRKQCNDDRLRIVYCGRLVQYQKRVLDFIDLAHELDALETPYTITLIGSFSPRDEAESLFPMRARDLIADGRIVLAGRMDRDQIFRTLADQDFFALVSDFEGLPLALVEGMARGCVPVVADMDSGIPEIVRDGENGLLLETRDYQKWAKTMVELWEDRSRYSRMSQQARRTVRQRFTTERVARQFDKVLGAAMAEIIDGAFARPPALHWGHARAPFGDVLPPPSMHRPINVVGLG